MKKEALNITIISTVIMVLFGLTTPVAYSAQFNEGVHYIEIPFSDSLDTGKKVEVREFFWYGCPHCFSLEPLLEKWLKTKPKAALFIRTPAFLPRRNNHARAYYSMEALNKLDVLHGQFFSKVQNDTNKLNSKEAIVKFVSSNGIKKADFLKAWDSSDVDQKTKAALKLGQAYGIHSVPTMVIDGRFVVSSSSAGGHKKMLQVIDYLVNKIAKKKK